MTAADSDPVVVKVGQFRFNVTAKGILWALAFLTTGTAGPMLLASSTGLATSDEVRAVGTQIGTAVEGVRGEYDPRIAWERVRELALDNLRNGRPIHAGVDGYLR